MNNFQPVQKLIIGYVLVADCSHRMKQQPRAAGYSRHQKPKLDDLHVGKSK